MPKVKLADFPIICRSIFPKSWTRIVIYVVAFWLFLKALAFIIPLPQEALFRPTATLVFDRHAKLLRAFTARDDMWRVRTTLSQISPLLQKMLLQYEDQWFYWHSGVNPFALGRALAHDWRARRIVMGGSTLTMQIARIMEPKKRIWQNKVWEILRAWQLELRYTKRQLLEVYFNIAPYGGNIEGVAAAAWLYFGKEPTQLSPGEAALLAALPNNPSGLRPDLYPGRARAARNRVLKIAWRHGVLTTADYRAALAEPVTPGRQELAFHAPHLALELKNRFPGESRIYSTINQGFQLFCEETLNSHIRKLQEEGIRNGAIVVIDNTRHEVLAAVGSADFFNREAEGQVNGFRAPRSPGSALKPFIYALGLDNGVVSPQHYLEDVPANFPGGYAPENYDRTFNGVVAAREALARSLNVPAVNLLAALGDKGLFPLLRRARLTTVQPVDRYGLSIALGSCEVTLMELTALYSAFAHAGEYLPPRLKINEPPGLSQKLFSSGAAYLVTEMLTELRRPDLPSCWEFSSLPRVAWKTGTSYGHRDAWSIGYNPEYTVGVWIGNFSGEGRSGISGAEAAAPLLFDIFNRVGSGAKEGSWFAKPTAVATRQVCALSGQKPGPYCPGVISEHYLVNRSPDEECAFHQRVLIDTKRGYRLPPHYTIMGGRGVQSELQEKVYVQWPARVAAWREANGQGLVELPPLLPEWQQISPGQSPVIHSPMADFSYQLREGIDPQFQKIALEAAASNDVRKLYWFADDKLVGTVRPGEKLFFPPEAGIHRMVCQDDQGRSSSVRLVVKGP